MQYTIEKLERRSIESSSASSLSTKIEDLLVRDETKEFSTRWVLLLEKEKSNSEISSGEAQAKFIQTVVNKQQHKSIMKYLAIEEDLQRVRSAAVSSSSASSLPSKKEDPHVREEMKVFSTRQDYVSEKEKSNSEISSGEAQAQFIQAVVDKQEQHKSPWDFTASLFFGSSHRQEETITFDTVRNGPGYWTGHRDSLSQLPGCSPEIQVERRRSSLLFPQLKETGGSSIVAIDLMT